MARYLLDTNVLVFFILGESDSLSPEITAVLNDYNNQLYTTSVCVLELLQLQRIKKIQNKRYKTAIELHNAIESVFFIKILPFTEKHTRTLATLKIADAHNDPFDHSIISHAITDKLILVSSDRKFKDYSSQKLNFAYNKR